MRVRGHLPHFPEMCALITGQCLAFALFGALHVVAMNTPLVEHLSSSESDRGKAG